MASWNALIKKSPQRANAVADRRADSRASAKSPTDSKRKMEGLRREEKTKRVSGPLVDDLEEEEEEEEDFESDVDEEELLRTATPYDDEEEQSSIQSCEVLYEVEALSKFDAQEDGDLSFKQREVLIILESSRDDGWLLAENAIGERGLVPSNYVKQLSAPGQSITDQPGTPVTPRRGRDLWTKLRKNVNETSLGDVLCALGAIPSGFRDSTMAKLLKDSSAQYLASTWLKPRPSQTGMGFRDLKWNHPGDYLQPCPSKVSCEVIFYMAKNIPLPGKGVVVLSRHVRVAVFNKNDILSNIHTVKAAWSPQEQKTWKFIPKSQTVNSSLFHRVLTVRLDSNDLNLELLFEFAISFVRETTGEQGELSCGWCSLPLFDSSGIPTANKTYQLKLHGGTPFESGIEVDASNIKVSGGRLIPSILRANRMPHMYVRVASPSRTKLAAQALLPPTIITASTYNQAISCFRYMAGVACLRGRLGLPLQSSVVKPALNVFLMAINQSDVMDNTLLLLQEQLKTAKRANKRNLTYVAEKLEQILLQYIYPTLTSPSFPQHEWDNESVEKQRIEFLENMNKRTDYSPLLASDIKQKSFQIHEQLFTIYS